MLVPVPRHPPHQVLPYENRELPRLSTLLPVNKQVRVRVRPGAAIIDRFGSSHRVLGFTTHLDGGKKSLSNTRRRGEGLARAPRVGWALLLALHFLRDHATSLSSEERWT